MALYSIRQASLCIVFLFPLVKVKMQPMLLRHLKCNNIQSYNIMNIECLALVAFLVVVADVVVAVVVAVTVPKFPLQRDLASQVPARYYCDFFLVLGHDM